MMSLLHLAPCHNETGVPTKSAAAGGRLQLVGPDASSIHHLLCANDVRRHPDRSRYYVQVPGMFDLDMTDAHLLSPLVPWPGLAGPIGAERAHHIINAYSVAFFDKELRGQRVPLLDGPSERFPEVVFEHRP